MKVKIIIKGNDNTLIEWEDLELRKIDDKLTLRKYSEYDSTQNR
jgi:hypothetical protein